MNIRHLTVRRTSIIVALLVAIVAVPSAAWAFWTAGAVGAGTATTGTLNAPTDVHAGATGTDVTITWTSPTQTYAASTLGYEVKDDGGNTVCSAASSTATSCSYTASTGTYRYAVTAVFESWTATSVVSNQLTVAATPSAVDASAGSGQSTAVSTAFPIALAATVTDTSGAAVPGMTVTFTAPGTDASGTFADGSPTATSTTDASGVAAAPTFTANGTAGTYTVTATATGITGSAGFSLTNQAADPAAPMGNGVTVTTPDGGTATDPARRFTAGTVAITSAPATGSASSTADLGAITVELQDASGASVDAATATAVSLSSNSTGTAVFAATRRGPAITSVTIPSGSSSVSFFYGDTRAGTPTVTAAVAGLTRATQVVTVTPAAARSLTFTTQPPSSVAESFTVAVQGVDQFGNPASVTLALDNPDNVPGATLNGMLARASGADGIAFFPACRSTRQATSR